MDRVTFLLENSEERIGCLLNPESLQVRRTAGLRSSESLGGLGANKTDLPLLYSGRGRTELELSLFFDTQLALGSTDTSEDVRAFTSPLWNLAELGCDASGNLQPPRVRFLWGKAWNILGLVESVAERLEHFTSAGIPRRSYLRMRLIRVADSEFVPEPVPEVLPPMTLSQESPSPFGGSSVGTGESGTSEALLTATGESLPAQAQRAYGESRFWRGIAIANQIADPLGLGSSGASSGRPLTVPLLSEFQEAQS